MFDIGVPELILILVVALVIFGPGKLPEIGKAVGKSLSEFKKASHDLQNEISSAAKETSNEKAEEPKS